MEKRSKKRIWKNEAKKDMEKRSKKGYGKTKQKRYDHSDARVLFPLQSDGNKTSRHLIYLIPNCLKKLNF